MQLRVEQKRIKTSISSFFFHFSPCLVFHFTVEPGIKTGASFLILPRVLLVVGINDGAVTFNSVDWIRLLSATLVLFKFSACFCCLFAPSLRFFDFSDCFALGAFAGTGSIVSGVVER